MIWDSDTGALWSSREPILLCMYTIPPNSIGSTEENGRTHTKIQKFVISTPYQALIQEFDLDGVGWTQGYYKISIPV